MRAIARKLWGWSKAVLRWRVRLPLLRFRLPLWVILAVLIVLFGSVDFAMHETSRPLFCLSCHEMGMPVSTWRVSTHKDVSCSQCHIMPGTISMFKSKAAALRQVYLHMRGNVKTSAIQAHVPDANCKRCHPRTRNLIVYHDLQITHKAHWDRGIKCTFCHADVVHGPQAAFINTPRMETCYECHDGKQASNDCSTCHIVLGQRSPTTFSPQWIEAHKENVASEHADTCTRCHGADFCNNCHRSADPHAASWLQEHPSGYRKDPKSCRVCHALPGEQGEMAFCRDCHALRRAHSLDWITKHPQAFKQDPKDCARCHQEKFCSDCHAIYRQHPADWLATHPAQAVAKPSGCRVCHTQEFCSRCHEKAVPKSHAKDWPRTHGAAVNAGQTDCSICHQPGFCQACHESTAGKPKSHDAMWLTRHGTIALAGAAACRTCHASSFCDSCHGLPMPHPQGWLDAHPAAAKRDTKTCARCHDQTYCSACHRSTIPKSHQKDWIERHGDAAKANRTLCGNCHTDNLCLACHRGVAMPHSKDWPVTHGQQAKTDKDRQRCLACHAQSYCQTCHGMPMPHPSDWLSKHGAQAEQHSDLCLKCHGPKAKGIAATKSACSTCHEALAPPSHEAKDWLSQQHFVAGSDTPDLCTLCHGANSCDTCHAKRGVK
jgi:nitrate/TMAO reductase-like tetraheme cytochrome c subunit